MRIIDILNEKDVTLSFEVFPPKTEAGFLTVEQATEQIAALRPDFMSILELRAVFLVAGEFAWYVLP